MYKERKIIMSNIKNNIPTNNKVLLKWSAFRVEAGDYKQPYKLIKTPLTELVKIDGYTQFRDKLNWLYNHYSAENYQIVWAELDKTNQRRIQTYIQKQIIAKADYILDKQIAGWEAHFGDIPEWIDRLADNQRAYLLDRAATCYGLVPEEVELVTKQVYTLPKRVVKDINEYGESIYYSSEELNKSGYEPEEFNVVVGRVKVYSAKLQRLAENAVIRDARWMSQFNNTDNDLRELRETECDDEHNAMVPITDMQGPDSPYGLDVEFRDFLEPIYGDDEER